MVKSRTHRAIHRLALWMGDLSTVGASHLDCSAGLLVGRTVITVVHRRWNVASVFPSLVVERSPRRFEPPAQLVKPLIKRSRRHWLDDQARPQ